MFSTFYNYNLFQYEFIKTLRSRGDGPGLLVKHLSRHRRRGYQVHAHESDEGKTMALKMLLENPVIEYLESTNEKTPAVDISESNSEPDPFTERGGKFKEEKLTKHLANEIIIN